MTASRSSISVCWNRLQLAYGDSVTAFARRQLVALGVKFKKEGFKMPRNEGTTDRVLRVILGLALLSLVFVGPQSMWGLIGLVPLVTGLVGSCPVYTVLGIRTCPMKE